MLSQTGRLGTRGPTPDVHTGPAISTAHAKGRALAESGDLAGARVLLGQALADGELRLSRENPELAPLMIDLATVNRMLRRVPEARGLLRRAYAILGASAGAESVDALSAEGRLAAVTYLLGEPTEAYDWHLTDVGRRVLGPDHPAVRGARQRLSGVDDQPEETGARDPDAVNAPDSKTAPDPGNASDSVSAPDPTGSRRLADVLRAIDGPDLSVGPGPGDPPAPAAWVPPADALALTSPPHSATQQPGHGETGHGGGSLPRRPVSTRPDEEKPTRLIPSQALPTPVSPPAPSPLTAEAMYQCPLAAEATYQCPLAAEAIYQPAGHPGVYQRIPDDGAGEDEPPEATGWYQTAPLGGHLVGQPVRLDTVPGWPAPARTSESSPPQPSLAGPDWSMLPDPEPPGTRRHESHAGGKMLVASLLIAMLIGGAVIASQLFGPSWIDDAPVPPSTDVDASASPGIEPSPGTDSAIPAPAPPTDLALRDEGGSVTLTWQDPSDGTVTFFVSGARAGEQSKALATAPAGHTTTVIYGLSTRYDYCFVVSAVWGQELVLASDRSCTDRFSESAGTSGAPSASNRFSYPAATNYLPGFSTTRFR